MPRPYVEIVRRIEAAVTGQSGRRFLVVSGHPVLGKEVGAIERRSLKQEAMRVAWGNRERAVPYTTGICRFPPSIVTIHRHRPTN